MVSILKVVGLMSCGMVLGLGLSAVAQAGDAAAAAEDLKRGRADRAKSEQDPMEGRDAAYGQTIEGEVLRVEGETYFVQGPDGKEVRLSHQGDRIEATVNEQNRALSIRSASGAEAGQGSDAGPTPEASRDAHTSNPPNLQATSW